MDNISLYTSDYGQTIRVRTYASDVANATHSLRLARLGTSSNTTAATISGSVVVGDTDDEGEACYSVDYVITEDFLTTKSGTWVCESVATYANGVVTGSPPFRLVVAARATA